MSIARITMRRTLRSFALVAALAPVVEACGEPERVGQGGGNASANAADGGTAPGRGGRRRRGGAAAGAADAGVADAGTPDAALAITYGEADFVELDVLNRDPFRDFSRAAEGANAPINEKVVKLHDTSLEQMRLIAVITGVPVPFAMLQDPRRIGHVVVRGDYIGRDEIVNLGGADGMPVALNWKVERILPGELVLVREDPLHPDLPPLTRSMYLRDAMVEGDSAEAVESGQLTNTGDIAPQPSSAPMGALAPAPSTGAGETAPMQGPAMAPAPAPAPAEPTAPRQYPGVFGRRPAEEP